MGTGMIGMQWIIFIGIAVVSWLVQMNLQSKFKKYSKIPTGNGMTGADVALKCCTTMESMMLPLRILRDI